MDKKQKTYTVIAAVVIVVALIAVFSGGNATGNSIFDGFFKKAEQSKYQNNFEGEYNGLLAQSYLASNSKESLKGYEVKYDDEGELLYEISNNRKDFKYSDSDKIEFDKIENQINVEGEGKTITWRCGCRDLCHSQECESVQSGFNNLKCSGECTSQKECDYGVSTWDSEAGCRFIVVSRSISKETEDSSDSSSTVNSGIATNSFN
jgi:hypothetical protein